MSSTDGDNRFGKLSIPIGATLYCRKDPKIRVKVADINNKVHYNGRIMSISDLAMQLYGKNANGYQWFCYKGRTLEWLSQQKIGMYNRPVADKIYPDPYDFNTPNEPTSESQLSEDEKTEIIWNALEKIKDYSKEEVYKALKIFRDALTEAGVSLTDAYASSESPASVSGVVQIESQCEDLDYGEPYIYENELYSYTEDSIKSFEVLAEKYNLLLTGVPGTGKTKLAEVLAQHITGVKNRETRRVLWLDFTENTDYTTLIGGTRNINGEWKFKEGLITQFCRLAEKYHDYPFVLVLNELSRANAEAVLGPVFTAMEKKYRGTYKCLLDCADLCSDSEEYETSTFVVPDNIRIIATMNATDKGVKRLDMAMKERFHECRLQPIWVNVSECISRFNFADDSLKVVLERVALAMTEINKKIEEENEDYIIGHRYLMRYVGSLDLDSIKQMVEDLKKRIKDAFTTLGIDGVDKECEKLCSYLPQ